VIGYLSAFPPHPIDNFANGLKQVGLVDGQNLRIEYRWAEGRYERLPGLAAELVNRQVAVVVAISLPSALAAKAATTTIPVVFESGADPVELGLVDSLSRPTGNLTGISFFHGALGGKRLELLRELVPIASIIGYLLNPKNPNSRKHSDEVHAAARAMNQQIHLVNASTESEIDEAFATMVQRGAGALLLGDDPFFSSRGAQIVMLAARCAMPVMYFFPSFVRGGGLVSYAVALADLNRQTGIYAGRIVKGTKPSDLPIVQPSKFELVINLKTAKALGLAIPQSLLLRADEVIE
jgi:putative ABC transport system substrate-binding protein